MYRGVSTIGTNIELRDSVERFNVKNRHKHELTKVHHYSLIFYYLIIKYKIKTALCEGISPLGYWQEVNPSPTQTKPYNTLPPFEQWDSWSSYGAVRAYSDVIL